MNGKYTISKGSSDFMSGVRSPSALRPFPYYLTLLSPNSGVLRMFFWVRTVMSGNIVFLSEISSTSTESLGRPHGVQKPVGLHLGCKPCRSGTKSHLITALCNLKKQKQCPFQESPAGSLANQQEVRSGLSFSHSQRKGAWGEGKQWHVSPSAHCLVSATALISQREDKRGKNLTVWHLWLIGLRYGITV